MVIPAKSTIRALKKHWSKYYWVSCESFQKCCSVRWYHEQFTLIKFDTSRILGYWGSCEKGFLPLLPHLIQFKCKRSAWFHLWYVPFPLLHCVAPLQPWMVMSCDGKPSLQQIHGYSRLHASLELIMNKFRVWIRNWVPIVPNSIMFNRASSIMVRSENWNYSLNRSAFSVWTVGRLFISFFIPFLSASLLRPKSSFLSKC